MRNELWTEVGFVSLNKQGESLCGDRVACSGGGGDKLTLVLSDGLGSGVKANILATLTSTLLCRMLSGGVPLEECVAAVARTLPVCKVRGVAYSTFTVLQVDGASARVIQLDNPATVLLRGGEVSEYSTVTREIAGKTVWESSFSLREGDMLIAMSDGAEYAGVGQNLNFGWTRDELAQYASANYQPSCTAKAMAGLLADECDRLYGREPGDDTTLAVVRVRGRHAVNLWVGPPADKQQDEKLMHLFFASSGRKIVCGGTTGQLAARFLGKPIATTLDYPDPDVPPISQLEGVDLLTEGVVTLSKTLAYAQDFLDSAKLAPAWAVQSDGASLIARELFQEATDVHFFVGQAINPAHQDPGLPIRFGVKLQIITQLTECLEKMGKRVRVSYY